MLDPRHESLSGLPIRSRAPSPTVDFSQLFKNISIALFFQSLNTTFHCWILPLHVSPTVWNQLRSIKSIDYQSKFIKSNKINQKQSKFINTNQNQSKYEENWKVITSMPLNNLIVFILPFFSVWVLNKRNIRIKEGKHLIGNFVLLQLCMRRPSTTRRRCVGRRTSRGSSPPWWPRDPRLVKTVTRSWGPWLLTCEPAGGPSSKMLPRL